MFQQSTSCFVYHFYVATLLSCMYAW